MALPTVDALLFRALREGYSVRPVTHGGRGFGARQRTCWHVCRWTKRPDPDFPGDARWMALWDGDCHPTLRDAYASIVTCLETPHPTAR